METAVVDSIVATTSEGRLHGQLDAELAVFRNVPYASPPVGSLRFRPPAPPRPWSDLRDAVNPGPICPQLPARLASLMGGIEAPQAEDCLTLTIWAPVPLERTRPVLVWFHGGGYASGAGSLAWYSGDRIAREGDVVVVNVNYRVGALGYLFHPQLTTGNMGLQDQIAALRWIENNIANFGGDPTKITLMGQSGGAHSITCLMAMPATRSLVQRAVFLSTPFGMRTLSATTATENANTFLQQLKIDPAQPDALSRLQQAPIASVLEAQLAVMQRAVRPAGDPTPPFGPTGVGDLPTGEAFDKAVLAAAPKLDAILGTTRDEMTPFYQQDPRLRTLGSESLPAVAETLFGRTFVERINAARLTRPDATELQLLCDAQNVHYFVEGTYQLASAISACGRNAWVYQFDWQAPKSAWGACHCVELPFVFGSWQAFSGAPMLDGFEPEGKTLSTLVLRAIVRFVALGSPASADLQQWQPFNAKDRVVLHFDTVSRPGRAEVFEFG